MGERREGDRFLVCWDGDGDTQVRNNKGRSLGPDWSMYKVRTPPPHILDKSHVLVESNNNNNNNIQSLGTCRSTWNPLGPMILILPRM